MSLQKSPRETKIWQLISFGNYNLRLKGPTQLQLYSNIFVLLLPFLRVAIFASFLFLFHYVACFVWCEPSIWTAAFCIIPPTNSGVGGDNGPSETPEHGQQNVFAYWSYWSIKRILLVISVSTIISNPSFWSRNSGMSAKIEFEHLQLPPQNSTFSL